MKQYIALIVSLLVIVGLVSVSFYKYETRPKPKAGETLQQAVANEAAAKQTLKEHDAVANAAATNYTSVITSLTNQKVVLCGQIKTARLAQPLCQ